MSSIEVLKHSECNVENERDEASPSPVSEVAEEEKSVQTASVAVATVSEETSTEGLDEVFEAVTGGEEQTRKTRDACEQTREDGVGDAEKARLRMQTEQSERVLRELRVVLEARARVREEREAAALARKSNKKEEEEEDGDGESSCQSNGVKEEAAALSESSFKNVAAPAKKPKKPPRARNGDYKVENSAGVEKVILETPVSSVPIRDVSNSECHSTMQRQVVDRAFLLHEEVSSKPGSNISMNSFDDSFADYIQWEPLEVEEGEEEDEVSSSSSSEQATVKSVSSSINQKESPMDSCSDEDDGHTDAARKRSKLKSMPSLDSLHDPRPQQLRQEEPPAGRDCHSFSELRSISSPDIKKLLGGEGGGAVSSSPYESLETLPPGLRVAAALSTCRRMEEREDSSGESDSSGGDETGEGRKKNKRQMLKTYRRPLRPAAAKKEDREQVAAKRRSKRLRNRTISLEKEGKEGVTENGGAPEPDSEERDDGDGVVGNSSSYASKRHTKQTPLFLPPQRPFGFDAAVALQAAKKAVSGGFNGLTGGGGGGGDGAKTEEVFGDSSSE